MAINHRQFGQAVYKAMSPMLKRMKILNFVNPNFKLNNFQGILFGNNDWSYLIYGMVSLRGDAYVKVTVAGDNDARVEAQRKKDAGDILKTFTKILDGNASYEITKYDNTSKATKYYPYGSWSIQVDFTVND